MIGASPETNTTNSTCETTINISCEKSLELVFTTAESGLTEVPHYLC
jgi:hypothetical protein